MTAESDKHDNKLRCCIESAPKSDHNVEQKNGIFTHLPCQQGGEVNADRQNGESQTVGERRARSLKGGPGRITGVSDAAISSGSSNDSIKIERPRSRMTAGDG
jgi:hypothetical protein